MFEKLALIASVTLPLWNIPLIMRIIQRKCSNDISLTWALGVWFSFFVMAPQAFASKDIVWRLFNIVNSVMFSAVVIVVLYYRLKNKNKEKSHVEVE